jgi:hypothetical protein
VNSIGLISAQLTQQWTEARPRPRAGNLAEGPSASWLTITGFYHYYTESLTYYRKPLQVLILHCVESTTVLSAAEVRRAPGPAG